MTHPDNHATRAVTIKRTWGRKCDILLFATTGEHAELSVMKVAVAREGKDAAWDKAKQVWLNLYHDYLDQADWCVLHSSTRIPSARVSVGSLADMTTSRADDVRCSENYFLSLEITRTPSAPTRQPIATHRAQSVPVRSANAKATIPPPIRSRRN